MSELSRHLVVHGVVTDAALASPLAGVKVTLLSVEQARSVTTDPLGYFQFTDVLQVQNVLVQFQKDGYQTVTLPVNPSKLLLDEGCCDGGQVAFPGFGNNVDGFDASIALSQLVLVPVSGTVYAGTVPAKGAQVLLSTPGGTVGYQAKAGDDGRFTFAGVRPASWNLVVLPYDRDGDGLSDTQLFVKAFDLSASSGSNLGNLVIVLADVQRALVASSFAGLSKPYPVTSADLLGGLTGVLPSPTSALFLHFGAEVDPQLTSFELVAVEAGSRFSAPVALTVTWDHASVAHLGTGAPLLASSDATVGYELRIRSLRFLDGTVGIAPSPPVYGTIDFSVQALPVALAVPTPGFYLANQFTATQAATQAVVDASTIWLLDANGDFVFDTNPALNFSPVNPPLLSWQHTPGAVRYHLMARNTTSAGGNATGQLDWRELAAVRAPDPTGNPTVVAQVNPWTGGAFGYNGDPWSFGNHVLFAVVPEDALGFRAPIDEHKVLDISDTFPGLLTGVAVDVNLAFPFNATTELGASFTKAFRLSFSEQLNTTAVPVLTPQSSNLTVKKVLASAFGTSANAPSPVPLDSAPHAFLSLLLGVKGACTEVLLDRSGGDSTVPVRDAGFFAASVKALFLNTGGGFLAEAALAGANATTNLLTLAAALPGTGALLPRGSLVCALSGAAATLAQLVSSAGATLTVNDATPFFIGEQVLVYEPQTSGAGQIADVRTVSGVDTLAKALVLNGALSGGHTAASLVIPFNGSSGEATLRPSTVLTLTGDVVAGSAVELFVTGPSSVMVGDTVLIDANGDLKTTVDQVQVKVKEVKFAPAAAAVYSIVVDLPAGLDLLRGRAFVRALGDSIGVSGTRDTSAGAAKPLDPHRGAFTLDGVLY